MATATPAAIVTVPPPPGVPAGTLSVGALNGEPDRITAIGILPDAVSGDTISSFTMTIKEAGPPASGVNGAAAKIVACPITSFWVGGENGTWDTRPTFDCTLASAAGERGLDGTWSFDLLAIGQAWVDPNGTLAADGVVLVEDVASPTPSRRCSPPAATAPSSSPSPPSQDPTAPTPSAAGRSTTSAAETSAGAPTASTSHRSGRAASALAACQAPTVSTPTAGETPQVAPPRTIATAKPNVLGNFPGGLTLAVPLFIVLLGLLSYSLGPAGEPVAATRQRGVSRALAARASLEATPRPPTSLETS